MAKHKKQEPKPTLLYVKGCTVPAHEPTGFGLCYIKGFSIPQLMRYLGNMFDVTYSIFKKLGRKAIEEHRNSLLQPSCAILVGETYTGSITDHNSAFSKDPRGKYSFNAVHAYEAGFYNNPYLAGYRWKDNPDKIVPVEEAEKFDKLWYAAFVKDVPHAKKELEKSPIGIYSRSNNWILAYSFIGIKGQGFVLPKAVSKNVLDIPLDGTYEFIIDGEGFTNVPTQIWKNEEALEQLAKEHDQAYVGLARLLMERNRGM